MATKYGVNATLISNTTPSAAAGVGEQGGVMKVIYDSYTLTADLASGDVIYMGGKIPKGARIIDIWLKCDDLDASGGTLDVGWLASDDGVEAASADGFFANVDVATAADVFQMANNAASPAGMFKKFTASCQPVITTDGDTDATSGSIYMAITYILD